MNNVNEGIVSVVIPVYNVEAYLDRCVQSVVNQTYRKLEIILVDDGSPDACPSMCDAWAQKDKRIKVVHKENGGLGYARNTGIENATGEYICFFDSDDYVAPTTIEECWRVIEDTKADIVSFGNTDVTNDGKVIGERIPLPPKEVFSGTEIKENLIPRLVSHNAATGENWNLLLSACFSLISMQLIKRVGWKFVSEREIISEDFYSMFELYQFVEKAAFIRKALYFYVVNPKSLSRSYCKDRYQRTRKFAIAMMEQSKKYDCEITPEITTMYLGLVMGVLKQIVACKEKFVEKQRLMREVVQDSLLQEALPEYDYSGEAYTKKVLFWAMRKKSVCICYALAWLRNLKG
ncbi:MAG: glycosyltransferase family 2 protein [Clostridia bacterium]|nr:glycosyltransferase family 2 protein [Clostridia bacterium]